MIEELQTKFSQMKEFSPTYVENFICELGLSDEIDFLPDNYKKHFKNENFRLYFSPSVLAHTLIRLKPFLNVKSFTFYTTLEPIEYDIYFNQLFQAFFNNSSINEVECIITDEIVQSDISYISENVSNSQLKGIIENTKNVIVVENLYNISRLEEVMKFKKDNVISYYIEENTDNPKTSVAILYKSLAMFE